MTVYPVSHEPWPGEPEWLRLADVLRLTHWSKRTVAKLRDAEAFGPLQRVVWQGQQIGVTRYRKSKVWEIYKL